MTETPPEPEPTEPEPADIDDKPTPKKGGEGAPDRRPY